MSLSIPEFIVIMMYVNYNEMSLTDGCRDWTK